MLVSLLDFFFFFRNLDIRIYSLLEGNFIVSEFQKQVRKKHYKSQKSVRSQRDMQRGNSPGMLRMTGIIVNLPQTF